MAANKFDELIISGFSIPGLFFNFIQLNQCLDSDWNEIKPGLKKEARNNGKDKNA